MIGIDWFKASDVCVKGIDYIDEVSGGLFTYDGRLFDVDWNPI